MRRVPRLRTRSKTRTARSTKDGGKPHDAKTSFVDGKAPSELPALAEKIRPTEF
jgi:hypothetical protein